MKTQSNSDDNAQNQTMGLVESQVSIGSGARNIWSKLKKGPVKQEHSQMYAPGLAEVPELDCEQSFRSNNDVSGAQGYIMMRKSWMIGM